LLKSLNVFILQIKLINKRQPSYVSWDSKCQMLHIHLHLHEHNTHQSHLRTQLGQLVNQRGKYKYKANARATVSATTLSCCWPSGAIYVTNKLNQTHRQPDGK